jgi:hypothetical protein
VAPPPRWGTAQIVRERLGAAVRDLLFDRATMLVPALSVAHHREMTERTAGPVIKMVESLSLTDPARLRAFRQEYDVIAAEYFADNVIRQGYLMTRAVKI